MELHSIMPCQGGLGMFGFLFLVSKSNEIWSRDSTTYLELNKRRRKLLFPVHIGLNVAWANSRKLFLQFLALLLKRHSGRKTG